MVVMRKVMKTCLFRFIFENCSRKILNFSKS
jgi:hypothetical protein